MSNDIINTHTWVIDPFNEVYVESLHTEVCSECDCKRYRSVTIAVGLKNPWYYADAHFELGFIKTCDEEKVRFILND